jgi:hypothetical protein
LSNCKSFAPEPYTPTLIRWPIFFLRIFKSEHAAVEHALMTSRRAWKEGRRAVPWWDSDSHMMSMQPGTGRFGPGGQS